MLNKRKIAVFICIIIQSIFFLGCDNSQAVENEFGVKFIGGGSTNAVIINLPDDKVVLIDTGSGEQVKTKILESLDNINASKIDYLFFNTPRDKSVENTVHISDVYPISCVYQLNISTAECFEKYEQVLALENIAIKEAFVGEVIKGENYFIAVLGPDSVMKSTALANNDLSKISPIIYLEYNGVRFLFLGETDWYAQQQLLDNYLTGLYDLFYERYGKAVLFEGVDFVHLSNKSVSDNENIDLLDTLQAKNAVVTTSINSYNESVSLNFLEELYEIKEDTKVFVCANEDLSVTIDGYKKYSVKNN